MTGFKKIKSLRESSTRKAGGQKGHIGHTLKLTDNPDDIIIHKIEKCEKCGYLLDKEEVSKHERHQVFDLPPLKIEVTEHQAEIKECPMCGSVNKARFPEKASNIVQYGERVNGLATYLSVYQLLPFERLRELFFDVFKHPICKASLIGMNKKSYESLAIFDDVAREKLIDSSVAHVDESGIYCENKRQWLHVVSTKTITYYRIHEKRGKEAMDDIGILPHFRGSLVHDFWRAYLKYSCSHSLCNAHHLRELVFLIEEKECAWASDMKTLLLDIKGAVEWEKIEANCTSLKPQVINEFEHRYSRICDEAIKANPPPDTGKNDLPKKRGRKKRSKEYNLLVRLKDNRGKVLAFMYNFYVPFDNNLAERDIRMIKCKQKISGTFRTKKGAEYFCRIRAYISTIKKNRLHVLPAIYDAIRGKPFLPQE